MRLIRSSMMAVISAVLVGCGFGERSAEPSRLDLGAPKATSVALAPRQAIVLAPVGAARSLDSDGVVWRLGDDGMPQRYATFRWSSPPATLLRERLLEQLSLQGPVLMQSLGDGLPVLRVSLMQFEQVYTADGQQNQGVVTMQAVLTRQGSVLGQFRMTERQSAVENSAPAGAAALRLATDRLIEQLGQWIERTL